MTQDILIYIDDKNKLDASAAANAFASNDIKNRAYLNTLGAELALKYLVSENIDISKVKNIHSIKKILEETDIADVMLPNIHIDVRVIFDKNIIFIPKSHFEYELTPDIYLVFNLSKDQSCVKFLGFFEPKLINKNNENTKYYFIEKEKLSSAGDLINYIKKHKGNTDKEISDEEFETSERFIVSMADNEISDTDKKYLLAQLTKSAELRDRFIEYENFETLSYKAMNDPTIEKKETDDTAEIFQDMTEALDFEDIENLGIEEDTLEEPTEEEITAGEENTMPTNDEELFDENFTEEQDLLPDNLDDNMLSLDEIELPQEAPAIEPDVEEAFDGVALDTVDEIEAMPTIEQAIDGIELDNVNVEEIQETFEAPKIDTISLDNVETLEVEDTFDTTNIDAITLDTVEIPQSVEMFVDEPAADLLSLDAAELMQAAEPAAEAISPMFFEEVPEPAIQNTQEELLFFENTIEPPTNDSLAFEQDNSFDQLPDILDSDNNETSFGKNLLENLSAENEQNEELVDEYNEDVSSQTLLSEINNILNISDIENSDSEEVNQEINTEYDNTEDSDLNILYTEEVENEETVTQEETPLPQIPGSALYTKKSTDKKSVLIAGTLIATLAVASAFVFLKPKNNSTADIEQLPNVNQTPVQTTPEDILASNAPQPSATKEIEVPKQTVQELKTNPPKVAKSESYLEVNKLIWDVPDNLSHSQKMQNYLRIAGKSIKLSLSTDLLLATEYAYTNQVKVSLKLSKDGSVQDARMLSTSGSTQIDNIVLQSVKDTLNVVKPPSDEITTPDFNLNLIISF